MVCLLSLVVFVTHLFSLNNSFIFIYIPSGEIFCSNRVASFTPTASLFHLCPSITSGNQKGSSSLAVKSDIRQHSSNHRSYTSRIVSVLNPSILSAVSVNIQTNTASPSVMSMSSNAELPTLLFRSLTISMSYARQGNALTNDITNAPWFWSSLL